MNHLSLAELGDELFFDRTVIVEPFRKVPVEVGAVLGLKHRVVLLRHKLDVRSEANLLP